MPASNVYLMMFISVHLNSCLAGPLNSHATGTRTFCFISIYEFQHSGANDFKKVNAGIFLDGLDDFAITVRGLLPGDQVNLFIPADHDCGIS